MNFLKDFFAKKAVDVAEGLGKVVDRFIRTPDEKAEMNKAIQEEMNRHLEVMEANVLRQFELEIADKSSARQREIDFLKQTGRADYFQYFIGSIAVLTMFAIVIFILTKQIPEKNEHVVMLVIGEILGIVTGIYGYHYGSSMGSRIKDMKKAV